MTASPLASLKEALQQPFAPETIQFLPKEIHQENGKYVCLALPYANKRVYEDRLNELVFGEWSSPYTPPYAQGNKLIIPATVVILGVAHTDYGESYFTTTSKGGGTREDDNTATEAYSQAFRRACAKFLLGRYLYDLSKLTLPYDPKAKQIAITRAEHIAWVEKLYLERGLKPRSYSVPEHSSTVEPSTVKSPGASAVLEEPVSTQSEVASQTALDQSMKSSSEKSLSVVQPTNYPHDTFLDWVATQVERDPERIQGICAFYKVGTLAQLTANQRNELTRRLRKQANHQRQSPPLTSAAMPSM